MMSPDLPRTAAGALAALLLSTTGTALAEGEVNVYSYRQPYLIEPIFDAFTEESGIEVNTVFAKEGLIERLRAEGDNSPADLLLVVDVGRLTEAVESGVSQAVESETLTANIPSEDRDPEGHWYGLTNRARIIVTSKERVEPGLVETYEDLAKPELEGRICTRSGKHDYMVALIASMIAHHGEEETKTWLEGVKNNLARRPQGNDRAQVKAIAAGECDIAIINSYYMGAMASDEEEKTWADSVNIVFPNQGDRGTHMNISGVLMTSASPNPENALKLMEFMSGDEAQRIYAEANHEYPAKDDIPTSELVSSWGEFKADTLPLAEIAKHSPTATRLVDIVDYDG